MEERKLTFGLSVVRGMVGFGVVLGLAFGAVGCSGGNDAGSGDGASDPLVDQSASRAEIVLPSQSRPDVRGVHGAVSAGHPLASAAGYDVLKAGGNAVDAAVTMAAVLAVVRPHMNGVGGDAFALFYDGASGEVVGLNGSGRAGALADPTFFADAGADNEIPEKGGFSVSVPGAVAAWADALERFGTISLARALAPAIQLAEDGFPVSKRLGTDMAAGGDALNQPGKDLFLPGGSPPLPGALLRNPALGATLRRIASEGKAGFYRGAVAGILSAFLEAEGGYLREGDLAAHESTWVTPLEAEYEGHRILVMPPNTQGMAQLQLLGMAGFADLPGMGFDDADYLHTLIELKKVAFADRNHWVTDPDFIDIPVSELLDGDYLYFRSSLVDPMRATSSRSVETGIPFEGPASGGGAMAGSSETGPDDVDDSGDTVYLTAVDQWGNAVSWIQSLFQTFGSGLLEPETGIVLHNRGALFSLDPAHANIVAPGKRPYHTLTPLVALRDDALAFTLGTPGGDGQTQSLTQIINYLLLFGFTPQEAIEAPRFRSYPGLRVAIEDRFSSGVLGELADLGHQLDIVPGWTATFGGAQMIFVDPVTGTLAVASDPRREAYGIAY